MQVKQGRAYLTDAFYGFPLRQSVTLVNIVIERAAGEILHRIIYGVVGLEHLKHTHYVRMC